MKSRGLEAWNDHSLAWHERGIEDAALVMQQNLMIEWDVPNDDTWRAEKAATIARSVST